MQRALSPRGAQACRGTSEVFEPISSTNTNRAASILPAMSARQAALKSYLSRSRSLPPVFFRVQPIRRSNLP